MSIPRGPTDHVLGPTSGRTTISISTATRDRLRGQGRKGETYDGLLNRLLDQLENLAGDMVEFTPVERGGPRPVRQGKA